MSLCFRVFPGQSVYMQSYSSRRWNVPKANRDESDNTTSRYVEHGAWTC